MNRRTFVGAVAAASVLHGDEGWIELFNGRTLEGWRPSENKTSWKAVGGALAADGPRSHLFYNGPVHGADFKNFELEAECLAHPGSNSGVYFHTRYQENGFPIKGFEVQVNNTATGEGSYRERKKTGSLYGIRNIYKQFIADDRWFKINVLVRGKSVQVRLDGMLVVDYVEPTPPVIPSGPETERFLDHGTFALQCHNDGSKALFRSVRVKPLPDNLATPGEAPVVDETYRQIIELGRHNVPMVDYHTHLKEGLTLEQALAKSRRDGIEYGIAINCGKLNPVQDDRGAREYIDRMQGQPCFVAMQAEGREWVDMFSRPTVALFDYVFTDSMTWTDNRGRRLRLWIPAELGAIPDTQEFMDTLVARAVGIFEHEPVDIYANPTYLPPVIAKDYDALWTEARIEKVVTAAAKNNVAIELNNRYKIPSVAVVRAAKAAGCKFSFGSNNSGPKDLLRSEYGIRMVEECKLTWQDFFVPGAWCPKAIERKGSALRG
ncbi:MAG: family 16 glycoside hydrolase [Bryobacteraceae bacterium]